MFPLTLEGPSLVTHSLCSSARKLLDLYARGIYSLSVEQAEAGLTVLPSLASHADQGNPLGRAGALLGLCKPTGNGYLKSRDGTRRTQESRARRWMVGSAPVNL